MILVNSVLISRGYVPLGGSLLADIGLNANDINRLTKVVAAKTGGLSSDRLRLIYSS